jgi:hypothetical protein
MRAVSECKYGFIRHHINFPVSFTYRFYGAQLSLVAHIFCLIFKVCHTIMSKVIYETNVDMRVGGSFRRHDRTVISVFDLNLCAKFMSPSSDQT